MTDQPTEPSIESIEAPVEQISTDVTDVTDVVTSATPPAAAAALADQLYPPPAPPTPPTPQPLALVRFEGQELEMEASIAQDDQAIISALSAWYPMLATAKFTRSTTSAGRLVVEATKQGGTKGQSGSLGRTAESTVERTFCAHLDAADDALHPAVCLALEFDALERAGRLTLPARLARAAEIEAAMTSLHEQISTLNTFTRLMDLADPSPVRVIPLGF